LVIEVGDGVADDQRERSTGMIDRELRGHHAAEARAADDRSFDAESVEERGEIVRKIRRRPWPGRARRAPRPAPVVREEPVALREHRGLPEQPRRVVMRLEHHRRALAEGLVVQLDTSSLHAWHEGIMSGRRGAARGAQRRRGASMPVELQILFNVIGTITGVLFFVYATVQFRAWLATRKQETALTLMRTVTPPDLYSRNARRIFELPDDAPMDQVHALGPELEQAVLPACINYEH